MADAVVNSLKKLARAKTEHQEKGRLVERIERRLLEQFNRMLPSIGYRLVPLTAPQPQSAAPNGTGRAKRLQCPTCERRFAHPMHLARHMSATHKAKSVASKARRAKKSK